MEETKSLILSFFLFFVCVCVCVCGVCPWQVLWGINSKLNEHDNIRTGKRHLLMGNAHSNEIIIHRNKCNNIREADKL